MINFSLISSALLLLVFITASEAKYLWGLCTSIDSNIKNKEYNVTKMMGIWYEYLVTNDYKEG
jgi:hypothetical protein